MKLSIDREEKKGPFGGAYYEVEVTVVLTPEEKRVLEEQNLMYLPILGGEISKGGEDSEAGRALFQICGRYKVTISQLENGVRVKADSNELNKLAWFENTVREKCKEVKSFLDTTVTNEQEFKNTSSYEEEI